MANTVYPKCLEGLAKYELGNLTSVTVKAALMPTGSSYDAADTNIADVGTVEAEQTVTLSIVGGQWTVSSGTITFPTVTNACNALVLYVGSGVGVNRLLGWYDTKSDGSAFSVPAASTNVPVTFVGPVLTI